MWVCPLAFSDSAASVVLNTGSIDETLIGNTLCVNGGGSAPCPVIGSVTHFGREEEITSLSLAVNGKVTGPLIACAGGWFVRYSQGTPRQLTFTEVQVRVE